MVQKSTKPEDDIQGVGFLWFHCVFLKIANNKPDSSLLPFFAFFSITSAAIRLYLQKQQ